MDDGEMEGLKLASIAHMTGRRPAITISNIDPILGGPHLENAMIDL